MFVYKMATYLLVADYANSYREIPRIEMTSSDAIVHLRSIFASKTCNPREWLRNFGNSVYPALPVSFGGDTKIKPSVPSIW